jgi:hypothetical protein
MMLQFCVKANVIQCITKSDHVEEYVDVEISDSYVILHLIHHDGLYTFRTCCNHSDIVDAAHFTTRYTSQRAGSATQSV